MASSSDLPHTARAARRRARATAASILAVLVAVSCRDLLVTPSGSTARPAALRRASGDPVPEEWHLTWYIAAPSFPQDARFSGIAFGQPGDRPVPGHYTGGPEINVAVYRPSDGVWYVRRPDGSFYGAQWGLPTDSLVPADYDGDGRTDPAVWRASNGQWQVLGSISGAPLPTVTLGRTGDVPAPADYSGDGASEATVFRPGEGAWYQSGGRGSTRLAAGFGRAGDVPVPADYDGDGRADLAVWRPSTGTWYVRRSSDAKSQTVQFGRAGDVPVARDYDGDGGLEFAVWRPSDGVWYVRRRDGSFYGVAFGRDGDVPAPGRYSGGSTQYAAVRVTRPAVVPSAPTAGTGSSVVLQLNDPPPTCGSKSALPPDCTPIRIRWTSENPNLVQVTTVSRARSVDQTQVRVTVVGSGPGQAVIKAVDDADTTQVFGASTVTVPR